MGAHDEYRGSLEEDPDLERVECPSPVRVLATRKSALKRGLSRRKLTWLINPLRTGPSMDPMNGRSE